MEWHASSDGGSSRPFARHQEGSLTTIDETQTEAPTGRESDSKIRQLLTYEPLPHRGTILPWSDQANTARLVTSSAWKAGSEGQPQASNSSRQDMTALRDHRQIFSSSSSMDEIESNPHERDRINPTSYHATPRSAISIAQSGPNEAIEREKEASRSNKEHHYERYSKQAEGGAGERMTKVDEWLGRAMGGDVTYRKAPTSKPATGKSRIALPLSPTPSGSPGSPAHGNVLSSELEYATFSALATSVDSTGFSSAPTITEAYVHPPTPILSPSARSMIGIDSIAMLSMTSSMSALSTMPTLESIEGGGPKHKTRPSLSLSKSLPLLSIESLILTDGDASTRRKVDDHPDRQTLESRPKVKLSSSSSSSNVFTRVFTASLPSTSTAGSNATDTIKSANLFTPYTTLIRTATVPVGHFTSRPSRLVVQTRTEQSSPLTSIHLSSADEEGNAGAAGAGGEGQRTRENTAEGKPVGLGVGLDGGMEGFGIGLALHSWNGGWRGQPQSEGDVGSTDTSGTAPMTRNPSSHGHKRQRVRLKRADELVDWSDPGYRVASPRSASAPYEKSPISDIGDVAWATAPSSPVIDSWHRYQAEEKPATGEGDDWASFGTQDMWNESQCKKYEDRFGEGNVENDLQGALDDLQKRGKYAQSAAQSGISVNVSENEEHPAGTIKTETHPPYIEHGEEDDDWEDQDEGEIFVYGDPSGLWESASKPKPKQASEVVAGSQDASISTQRTYVQQQVYRSPPPPPSPQLNDSPERSWSGALGLDVAAEISRATGDLRMVGARCPSQPQFPASLGRISPFRHVIHLAAVTLGVCPEDLVEHHSLPRLVRACGIDLDLAKVLISAELEFRPLIGMHQTRHEIYTYYKQTFRNKEAVSGTFQMFILGLIQLATERPVGETAAVTLQSLMANMDVICLDFSGICLDHPPCPENEDGDTIISTAPLIGSSTEIDIAEREDVMASLAHALCSPIVLSDETCEARTSGSSDAAQRKGYLAETELEDLAPAGTADTPDEQDLCYSSPASSPLLDKGKGKMEYVAEEDQAEHDTAVDEAVDMAIEGTKALTEEELFDIPDLIADLPASLFFGNTMWSACARIIGMLSNKTGCPADHVLNMEEVAASLEKYPGITPVDFQEVLEEAMQRDRMETERPIRDSWVNFGDDHGIWRACRFRDALEHMEVELGGWHGFMFGIVSLLQLYFGFEVGQHVKSFWNRLGSEQIRYSHLPFEPSTPSTVISSPPTQHYPDPYLAESNVYDRLEELERVARLQIGPSTKRW